MNIVLIDCFPVITTNGLSLISALLKRSNHNVKRVMLSMPMTERYTSEDFSQMDTLLVNADIIMLSVFTIHACRAAEVTAYIHGRFPGMIVIWGGPHCVAAPELSLQHADGVCFSEGDIAVLDLVERMSEMGDTARDYRQTLNMAFRIDGEIKTNEALPPFSDLDSLPHADLDPSDIFSLKRRLEPFTDESLIEHTFFRYPFNAPTFRIITSRGCPFRCAYCHNSRFFVIHGHNPVRFRSVGSVIDEIEAVLNRHHFFDYVGFGDDDFLSRPLAQIEEFGAEYKQRIGLPFSITSSASTYQQDKMDILLDAGLRRFALGVQTGSKRVLREVFNRKIDLNKTKEVAQQIDRGRQTHGVELILDFIIDTPYETTDEIIDTYRYIVDSPHHARINIFKLQFLPGTPIYERALRDGLIEPYGPHSMRIFKGHQIFFQQNYETFLILIVRGLKRRGMPRSLMHWLGGKTTRRFASLIPWTVFKGLLRFIVKS